MSNPKIILFCILDWGLGHATRSIPIIQYLQRCGHHVIIASSKQVIDFLQHDLSIAESAILPAYQPVYRKNILLGLGMQIPHFVKTFIKDRKKFKSVVDDIKPNLIISDNRFSCYSGKVKSLYMTHQLQFELRGFLSLFAFIPELAHDFICRQYDHCLIPDTESDPFAGRLSRRKARGEYLGLLSRFDGVIKGKADGVVILLSGPEPARSLFEKRLVATLGKLKKKVTLVRGVETPHPDNYPTGWVILDRCNMAELKDTLKDAELVICRSGYSSLMDLVRLGKKALLIPTPGQPEQEYLATYLSDKGWFSSVKETDISEQHVLEALDADIMPESSDFNQFQKVFDRLLKNL